MAIQLFDLPNTSSNVRLRLAKGHFATSHSHINYYIDLTMTKHRLSEAREAAAALCAGFRASAVIDTILCLDGTEVIGACMASELTKAGFSNMNAHRTIYVVTPEHTSGSQLIFRDNIAPMIVGKHVLVLAASVTTGYTVQAAVEQPKDFVFLLAGIKSRGVVGRGIGDDDRHFGGAGKLLGVQFNIKFRHRIASLSREKKFSHARLCGHG